MYRLTIVSLFFCERLFSVAAQARDDPFCLQTGAKGGNCQERGGVVLFESQRPTRALSIDFRRC